MIKLMVRGIISAAVTLSIGAGPGHAQMACAARDQAAKNLNAVHQEAPVAAGVAENGFLIEVFASPQSTFTILITRPDGVSCLIATGDGWIIAKPTKPKT